MAARETLGVKIRRRLIGLLYIVVVFGLVLLSILIYNKTFSSDVKLTLYTDHTGNSLQKASDVKERGIIVGSVRSVHVVSGADGCNHDNADCVKVTLAISRSRLGLIPQNVTAQILPKTIFGEQYVSLIRPAHPGPAIKSGGIIRQDRSKGALETEKVIGDLLPLLQAVQPAELNATLTAVATALKGRGAELGHTLTHLDSYLKQLNPHTAQIADDLGKLGRVADEYNGVAPDIFRTLTNLETSAHTVISQRQQLSTVLTTATDTSNVLASFLSDNEQRLIQVNATGKPIFSLLNEYAPEYTCLIDGLSKLEDRVVPVFRNHTTNLSVTIDQTNQGKYLPGQQPRYITGYGPHCFGLPDNPQPIVNGHFQVPGQFRCLNDGAPLTADPCAGGSASSKTSSSVSTATQSAASTPLQSPAETALVKTLISGSYGAAPNRVPDSAAMLGAPLLRGTEVTVK